MQLGAADQDKARGHAFSLASIARSRFLSGNFTEAYKDYVKAFTLQPRAWWLASEALRCLRMQDNDNAGLNKANSSLVFSPDYQGNSYQRNLYISAASFGYKITATNSLVIDNILNIAKNSRKLVFHQHWLKEIYWKASTYDEGVYAIDLHMSLLMALKANGAIICWTLHNLMDHDATALQCSLCDYAIRRMSDVSTYIFSHTAGSGTTLSEYCSRDLSKKIVVLEHHLYDNLKPASDEATPKELSISTLNGKRVFLSMGMLRPYKGIPELLTAFEAVMLRGRPKSAHLIVAGQIYDPDIRTTISQMNAEVMKNVTIIGRKLTDQEMVRLISVSNVSVTPYKKVLTSGSFFLSTTFGLATIAPAIGAFPEIIEDKVTGFLYDGSVPALANRLEDAISLADADLKKAGLEARERLSRNTIASTSGRFFSILEDSF